jgi:glycosyltransferase involved in cell wall biosynthesis
VIPTYNHGAFVLHALESVLAQTFSDFEIIVINDGSPDDTAQRLRPLAEAEKIRYIDQPNAGQGMARNRGIALARGEFLALLDDDDLWPPDKLQWQVQALRARPAAVMAYGPMETFGGPPIYRHPGADAPTGRAKSRFFEQNWIRSPGQTLMRLKAFGDAGGFDTEIWGCDDWDLWLRLADVGEFIYQDRLALRYRNHAANASKNVSRMYRNARKVQRKHLGRWPSAGNVKAWRASSRFIRQFSYNDALRAASTAAEAGHAAKAIRLWALAVRVKPWGILGATRRVGKAMMRRAKNGG